jgi:serpin B
VNNSRSYAARSLHMLSWAVLQFFFAVCLISGCAAGGQASELAERAAMATQGRTSGLNPVPDPTTGTGEATLGSNVFAVSLYAALSGQEGNLSFSPLSISSCLAMAYEGARGKTREEMARVLHFPRDRDKFHSSIPQPGAWISWSSGSLSPVLSMANALWGQQGYRFVPEFLQALRQYHASELRQVDFAGKTDGTRHTINRWVEEKTGGKIQELISQGVLGPDTKLVLTNAVYFKGSWVSRFLEKNTRPGIFSTGRGRSMTVAMMEQTSDFRYMEVEGASILEMPYAGGGLSMVVLLPKDTDGLFEFERSLSSSMIEQWMGRLLRKGTMKVHVRLPRFRVSSAFELGRTLSHMGMPTAFQSDADFSGMTGSRELFIGNVLHKAFVEVNEEGTEAAAASAAVMTKAALRVYDFTADHPFLFLILEHSTGNILFMGRLVDPKD